MKKAAEVWTAMSSKDKRPYEKMHEEDVQREKDQYEELIKKGYFTMADGSKSSEHLPKEKKKRAKKSKKAESESEDLEESEEEEEEPPKKMKKKVKA